uniref:Uncharacterized protein n=1 Tax=Arundo donax TaxID=35708 RepID=A0A0A9F283_ARUDO
MLWHNTKLVVKQNELALFNTLSTEASSCQLTTNR